MSNSFRTSRLHRQAPRHGLHRRAPSGLVLGAAFTLGFSACGDLGAVDEAVDDGQVVQVGGALSARHQRPSFTTFAFTSRTSRSGFYADGDVRLDAVAAGTQTWDRGDLQTVRGATILVDDGVDVVRGGHNFASGQGINSVPDPWETEGPATITPTSQDLAGSLGNFNLTSIVVTRENVGTASLEVEFPRPSTTFFFWERGSTASATTANSDVLVEALDDHGLVVASHKLLRTEYAPTGIAVTTWNGSFASPATPDGVPPQLGSVGLSIDTPIKRLRLTSVQQDLGGVRDDGPDYKVIAADLERHHAQRPTHDDEELTGWVADLNAGTDARGALFRIDLATGRREIVSDFGNAAQGPLGLNPLGVNVEGDGSVVVTDTGAGRSGRSAIFRVNPRNGRRHLITDFGDVAQGPLGLHPEALHFDDNGDFLVADENHPDPTLAFLVFKVDRDTGRRRVLADFSDASKGPVTAGLERVVVEPGTRNLIVTDRDFGPERNGALFRVERSTGLRTIVSDFGAAALGPIAVNPEGIVFEADRIVVIQDENEEDSQLIRVDLGTGRRALISRYSDPLQGVLADHPEGLGALPDGRLLVVDEGGEDGEEGASGAVLVVDPSTGFRTRLTDFGDATQGPLGVDPAYIDVQQSSRHGHRR